MNRNFRWCQQWGVINTDSFWPLWCSCCGKLGAGSVALRLQSHLERVITRFAFGSWCQDPQVRGFLQQSGFCGIKSLITRGMPAGDCCWQCFLQRLTWAVWNTSASCTFFIRYICELFIDFHPSSLFFFFFLLTATDAFVINYLVGIVWHKTEYFTNDYVFLLCVAFLPALLWSPHSWSHGRWQ